MVLEYIFILKYFFITLIVALLLFFISILFVYQQFDSEKSSSYECGFNPFGDARNKFEIRFYLVAILFIIFDLELIFLFPWILTLHLHYLHGIYSMLIFMIILTLGFVYEWMKGALDWD